MKRHRRTRVGFDLTPMIDVTFLLIVFFMLASEFSKVALARLELPGPLGARPVRPHEHRVIVNVTQRGGAIHEIDLEGRRWAAERFGALLAHLRALHGADLEIELRADKRLKWQAVAPLLSACGAAGIRTIHFVGENR